MHPSASVLDGGIGAERTRLSGAGGVSNDIDLNLSAGNIAFINTNRRRLDAPRLVFGGASPDDERSRRWVAFGAEGAATTEQILDYRKPDRTQFLIDQAKREGEIRIFIRR